MSRSQDRLLEGFRQGYEHTGRPARKPTWVTPGRNAIGVPLAPVAPVNIVLPTVVGTAQVGQTLQATVGAWTGSPFPSFTRQWQRGTTAISGANGQFYTAQEADVGSTLRVVVTATNGVGSPASATSASTAVVTASGGGEEPTAPVLAYVANTNPPEFTVVYPAAPSGTAVTLLLSASADLSGADTYTGVTGDDPLVVSPLMKAYSAGTRYARAQIGSGTSDIITATLPAPASDAVAPVLTALSVTAISTTTATLGVTTDEAADGWWGVYPVASTPTASQVIAGTGAVVSGYRVLAAGANTVPVTGLSATTEYKAWWVARDAYANQTAATASASFTTQGVNLVTNGTFDSAFAPWFGATFNGGYLVDDSVLSVVSGRLRVANAAGKTYSAAYLILTGLTIGQTYRLIVDYDISLAVELFVQVQTGFDGSSILSVGQMGGIGTFNQTFVATQTSHHIQLLINSEASDAVGFFDNVVVF